VLLFPDVASAVGLHMPAARVTTIPLPPPPSPFDSPESSSLVSFSIFITPPSSPPPQQVDECEKVKAIRIDSNHYKEWKTMSAAAPGDDGVAAAERRPLLAGTDSAELIRDWDGATITDEGREYAGGARDSDAEEGVVGGGAGTFKRNLGAVEAFAIVISIVIGSGVFTSPGSIDTNGPSPGAALLVWLVGGVLAWTGASTMAELGTAIPGEGMDNDCTTMAELLTVPQVACSRISSTYLGMYSGSWQPGRGWSLSCPPPWPYWASSSSRASTPLPA
jgi:hypothetical protein